MLRDILEVDAVPFDGGPAYPAPPRQTWDARAPRIVRRSIEGDDGDDGGEQFPSAHDALRSWHRWLGREASTVKSSSSPSRFGARVDGGRPPTVPGRITAKLYAHAVLPSVVDACRAGYVTSDGRVRLGELEVASVIVGILDGLSAQQIADDLNAARAATGEHAVTSVHVGLCRARAWSLIGESLVSRGLLERERHARHDPTRRKARRPEERMALPPGFDLEGAKDLAAHCGMSESTILRLIKRADDPMPTSQYLGRIVARRAEIDAWRSRQVQTRAAGH